jgi:hypothetical protein
MTATQKAIFQKIIATVPVDDLKVALLNEYKRRIIRYRMVNEAMKKKYGVSFHEFESRNVVKEQDYSWQVESDSMEWEHAMEGLRYAEEKLKEIQQQ